ncbi:MAG: MipA/OmpV family protein [Planctomycetota bacterium]|jgi:outer membrane protein
MGKYFLACLIVIFAVVAFAQENQAPAQDDAAKPATAAAPEEDQVLKLGLGVTVFDVPHKGIGTEAVPVPVFVVRQGRLAVSSYRAGYELFTGPNWSAGPTAKVRFEGYDASDSSRLAGMSDRDNTLEIGFSGSLRGEYGAVEGVVYTDALGKHKGQELQLNYVKPLPDALGVEGLLLRPSVGVSWRTKHLNDYYYGVRNTEAAPPARPAYKAGDTVNPFVGLSATYALADRWDLVGSVRYEWLGSEITDSPVVSQHHLFSVMVGFSYRL